MTNEEIKDFILTEYKELCNNHRCEACSVNIKCELCDECNASYYTGTAILIRLSKKINFELFGHA